MKRSEMVAKLRESFLKHMHCSADCCETDPEMYSAILQEIEDSGMTPPEYENHNPSQSLRTFSSDGDWARGKDNPDGSKHYFLYCIGWENE